MKRFSFLLSLFFLLNAGAFSQKASSPDENKYRINLPDFWKPGNKVWQILTNKLPVVCEELADKDICGDHCNPKYTIEFQMSEPYIYDYRANPISSGPTTRSYNFVTSYSFECSLLLFDEKDKLITKIILVDANETWTVTNRAELRSYVPPPPVRPRFPNNPSSQGMVTIVAQQNPANWMTSYNDSQGQTPYSYINDNMERLSPGRKDMLMVVDHKLRNL